MADKVEDDNDAIPVDETKSTGGAGTVCPRGWNPKSREGSYSQARDVTTTTTNARRKVVFTHCGLKVHSYYLE